METVGVIGLGKIGLRIADNLIKSGYRVVGYRRHAMTEFASLGGKPADSPADVGAAAAAVLANPEPHIGKVYDLTGPQSLTMTQYAEEFSGALGRTIKYVNVPPQIWEAKLQEAKLPAYLIAHLSTMGQLHR